MVCWRCRSRLRLIIAEHYLSCALVCRRASMFRHHFNMVLRHYRSERKGSTCHASRRDQTSITAIFGVYFPEAFLGVTPHTKRMCRQFSCELLLSRSTQTSNLFAHYGSSNENRFPSSRYEMSEVASTRQCIPGPLLCCAFLVLKRKMPCLHPDAVPTVDYPGAPCPPLLLP